MGHTIQIRGDILFQFDHAELGGDNYRFFHLNEFITRVEKVILDGDNEVRYGIMLDYDGDESHYQKSYILEIPVSATNPVKRKEEQEQLIKDYIDEMREKFQNHYKKETDIGTVDDIDKVERKTNSPDGLWSILRNFRKNHLVSFSEWLFAKKFDSKAEVTAYLTRSRMTFETEQEYLVSVDWPNPYICFKHDYNVSHFKTDAGGSASLFYPFHNFYWQDMDLCTSVTVERDYDYAKEYQKGIELRPNNYSLFAYYTYLIDNIYTLQQKNYDEIKDYYVYASNLAAIQDVMLKNGPLAKYSEASIPKFSEEDVKDFDGGVSDDFWEEDHLREFALGMADLSEFTALMSNIIAQESHTGRNANRTVRIESLAAALQQSFFDNSSAHENYSDLWAFNKDKFGFDIILRKIAMILMKTRSSQTIFSQHLLKGLYQHPILEDTAKAARKEGIDFAEWGNIFYRTNAITFETWIGYYDLWEQFAKSNKVSVQMDVAKTTVLSGEISTWIQKNVIFPASAHGKDASLDIKSNPRPDLNYGKWKMDDAQTRKLADFLLGGNKAGKIAEIEEKLVAEIQRLFGTVEFEHLPYEKVDELHRLLLKYKTELVAQNIPEANTARLGHAANFGASALNLYLVTLAYGNAYKPGASGIDKLRAHTVAFGLFSDVANTIARFKGVQSTLLKSVARQAGGRVALGLGAAEFIGGGVGGVLGVVWFGYDAFGSYSKGNRKDAMLDSIAAIGCAITTVGLFLDASVVGIIPGLVCNVVGIAMVLVTQLLKYFRTFSNNTEDFCKHMYNEDIDKGGADQFSRWEKEFEGAKVAVPTSMYHYTKLKELTERVNEFLSDMDTFDMVKAMPSR